MFAHGFNMRFCLIVLFLVILVSVGQSAVFTSKMSAQGLGSMVVNSDRQWASGDNLGRINPADQYIGGDAMSQLLTAPGNYQYQSIETVDATQNNRYTKTGFTKFENGGTFTETSSANKNVPNLSPIRCDTGSMGQSGGFVSGNPPSHQWISGSVGGILQSAEIDTAKFTSDMNWSLSQQAAWDGAGLYTGETIMGAHVGADRNSTVANYDMWARDKFFTSTNTTGGSIARPEWSLIDFSDSFVSNSSSNETVNITVNQS